MDMFRLLTVGNSFSDDAMEYVWQIAASLGVPKIELGNLYIGGCSLATHRRNAESGEECYEFRTNTDGEWHTRPGSLLQGIRFNDWDFISMQQASAFSGISETYNEDLIFLKDFIKAHATNRAMRLVWHQTWAYPRDSVHPEFPRYEKNQDIMYLMIVKSVREKILPLSDFVKIIPSGTAIQNARTSFLSDSLNRDECHLSVPLGRYIAGLTLVRELTGRDISKIAYAPEGVTEREKRVATESAENACLCKFGTTLSNYKE